MWERELEVATAAAREGGEAALPFFGKAGTVTWKADDSPVGDADHAADTAIQRRLHTAFPEDTILTEESGERPGRSGRRWIVDPVDGTRDFLHGLRIGPTWSPSRSRATSSSASCACPRSEDSMALAGAAVPGAIARGWSSGVPLP